MAAMEVRAIYLRRVLERMGRLGWPPRRPALHRHHGGPQCDPSMRMTLENLATFQGAFNEDPPQPTYLVETEYIIDPNKRPCEAGYRTPKPKG